jgi:hypothetical protein
LLAAGVSRSAIGRALRVGKLHHVYRGVYAAVAPELLTEEGQLLAALLAAGDGALLSHGTAAWRWRIIPAPPSLMQLAVPRDRAEIDGLRLFVSSRLRPGDVTSNGRFPTTSVPRTLLDLATRYNDRALLRALAEAEFHHDLRPADVERTLRRGHPGSANLRAALKEHTPGHGEVKSQLERRFRRLLIKRGIELPLRNEELAGPGRSTASGLTSASSSSSTDANTSARTKPTPTTTATSGSAATATRHGAMASGRSTSGRTTWSPTSSLPSATPRPGCRSGCCKPRRDGRRPRRSARA